MAWTLTGSLDEFEEPPRRAITGGLTWSVGQCR